MESFPVSPIPQYSYTTDIEFKTLTSQFENGAEQRRSKWSRGKMQITLAYNVLTKAQIALLWSFYIVRKGSFETFYFTDLNLITGGISTIHTTPTAGGTGYTANDILTVTTGGRLGTVKVNTVNLGVITAMYASPEVAGVGYTTGTGKATVGGTGSGATINITAIANNIYTVRFLEDRMSFEVFTYNLQKTGLKLIEVF